MQDFSVSSLPFAHHSVLLCSLPPPFQVRVGALPEKSCMFYEKSWKIILPVRGNVVPLHSLSEKNPVGKRKEATLSFARRSAAPRQSLKASYSLCTRLMRSLTYCKQQQGSVPISVKGFRDVKQDTSIQINDGFDRAEMPGTRQTIYLQCLSFHTLLYNI